MVVLHHPAVSDAMTLGWQEQVPRPPILVTHLHDSASQSTLCAKHTQKKNCERARALERQKLCRISLGLE